MNKTKLDKEILQSAIGKEGEVKLYLSKDVFNHKDLKATDIRLLIVLSSIKGTTVEQLRKYGNILVPWITRQSMNNSKMSLYKSLTKLQEKGLVDKEGYGLDLKKNYILFTEKQYELLNNFKTIRQLFMISARIWNRNQTNQIVNVKYLDIYLPSNRRTEYFNSTIKALGFDSKSYGYFLDGNTFKKNLDGCTKNEKMVILAQHKGYEEPKKKEVCNCMEEDKEVVKTACEPVVDYDKEVDLVSLGEKDYLELLEKNKLANKKAHQELYKNEVDSFGMDRVVLDNIIDEDTDFPY